jgi:hypothetical protein
MPIRHVQQPVTTMNMKPTRPYAQRLHPGKSGTISARISEEASRMLDVLARMRGMSKSEYLCRLLNDHLRAGFHSRAGR